VREIVLEMDLLSPAELEDILQPERMVAPVRLSLDRGERRESGA
jgi:aspartate ammonia-lyase